MARANWLIAAGFVLTIGSCLTTLVLGPRYASDDFSRVQKAVAWNLAWLPFALAIAGAAVGLEGHYRKHRETGAAKKRWVGAILFLGVWATLAQFVGITSCGKYQDSRSACVGNLRYLGIAFHSYYERNLVLPPSAILGNDGRAWHSWRLLVSVDTAHRDLFEAYHQDEPWDGPHNLAIANTNASLFRCPHDGRQAAPGTAEYVVVQGHGFVFDRDESRSLHAIKDPLERTILVVEVADTKIAWTEPRDLTWERFLELYREHKLSQHRPGFPALMVDGSVQFFEYGELDEETLHGLFTIAGGEQWPSTPRK